MGENLLVSGKKACESQQEISFRKGEVILTITDRSGQVGVIRKGLAHISMMDNEGRESTIELLNAGDCFGEYFLKPLENQEYIVFADTDCRVMFINYQNVFHHCKTNCENHTELVKGLLMLTANKAQSLSLHVNVLSQRTLRAKLMTYLGYQREASGSRTVLIPVTLGGLADYLCVDRSAMMREIRKMNDDGLIRSEGRCFTLL